MAEILNLLLDALPWDILVHMHTNAYPHTHTHTVCKGKFGSISAD